MSQNSTDIYILPRQATIRNDRKTLYWAEEVGKEQVTDPNQEVIGWVDPAFQRASRPIVKRGNGEAFLSEDRPLESLGVGEAMVPSFVDPKGTVAWLQRQPEARVQADGPWTDGVFKRHSLSSWFSKNGVQVRHDREDAVRIERVAESRSRASAGSSERTSGSAIDRQDIDSRPTTGRSEQYIRESFTDSKVPVEWPYLPPRAKRTMPLSSNVRADSRRGHRGAQASSGPVMSVRPIAEDGVINGERVQYWMQEVYKGPQGEPRRKWRTVDNGEVTGMPDSESRRPWTREESGSEALSVPSVGDNMRDALY
jgi:hypothetical protein